MTIAFVKQIGNESGVAGQTSFASTSTTFAAGNLLVAIACWSYSGVGASITVNAPAAWTSPLVTKNDGAPNGGALASYLPNNAGGAQSWTWTVTANGGGTILDWAWTIYEFSGVATSSPLDLTAIDAATGGTSSTSIDPGAASGTTQSGDLLLHLFGTIRSTAPTYSQSASSVPSTGWTVGTAFNSTVGTSPFAHVSGTRNILSGTQASPHSIITSSVSTSSISYFLTFKQAAAGVAFTPNTIVTVLQAANRAASF